MSVLKVPSVEAISTDQERVNALYAPFRPREANPEHYDRKLKFWTKAIEEYGVHCNRVSFTVKELHNAFRINGKSPACLDEVVTQYHRSGTIVTENEFQEDIKASESWSSWSQTSAKRIFRKFGAYVPSPISYFYKPAAEEIRFVNVELLKKLITTILSESKMLHKTTSISNWTANVTELTKVYDSRELEYLLQYICSRRHAVIDKVGSEEVILVAAIGTQPKITAIDKGKYDIVRTKEILETQLTDITEKVHEAEERARASLKQGRRNTAKHELKRKKLLEQRMEKLLTLVDNLTVLAIQIEDAETDAVIISTYEAGKKALAGVLEDKQLNADRATEAMLDIQELLEEHADISAALSQPVNSQDADLAELEEELELLMKEDEGNSSIPQKSPQTTPDAKALPEDEETMKLLEALSLTGLDDVSNTPEKSSPSSQVHRLDTSGDV